jgi:hypothetical protein
MKNDRLDLESTAQISCQCYWIVNSNEKNNNSKLRTCSVSEEKRMQTARQAQTGNSLMGVNSTSRRSVGMNTNRSQVNQDFSLLHLAIKIWSIFFCSIAEAGNPNAQLDAPNDVASTSSSRPIGIQSLDQYFISLRS